MEIHTIQLNIAKIEAEAKFMDATEFGAYLSLVISCYQSEDSCLPDENSALARVAKCTPHVWKKIRPKLEKKFKIFLKNSSRYWVHERVQKDIIKYKNLSKKNKENANKRWKNEGVDKKEDMPVASKPHTTGKDKVFHSQYDRNATQYLTPITELLKPPLPPNNKIQNIANSEKGSPGGLKQSFNGAGGWKTADVSSQLTDEDYSKAKENAPDWDITHLMGVYVTGINQGMRKPPNSITKAFPAWCKVYTKGRTP